MGSLFPRLASAGMGDHTMRIFGYLGFLIPWLLAPAPMAITVADTASVQAVAPDGTQSHLAEEEVALELVEGTRHLGRLDGHDLPVDLLWLCGAHVVASRRISQLS